jgi:hypothetical protein
VSARAHVHRVASSSPALPFFGPVAERQAGQNPAAWGNVRIRQRCRCGATREILVNGAHDELGPWVQPPALVVPLARKVAS